MNIVIYDPSPPRHDYLSPMFFAPMRQYAARHGLPLSDAPVLSDIKNSTVCCLADYLEPDAVAILKNNGNKIVGFSVTDSSYVSQCCREAKHLRNLDLVFMLAGLQKVNEGREMIVTSDLKIALERRQFLPEEDWAVFDSMRKSGRLQSLPYVHAERQPAVQAQPYNTRSQKALIRGGHHMRRFILALKLMEIDRLDINSGFVTEPYFQDWMNPQFRYCDDCRDVWKMNRRYPWSNHTRKECTNEHARSFPPNLSDLGYWNNKCPQSFYDAAHSIGRPDPSSLMMLLNAKWLTQREHLEMLARITFTSDLKWLFSIYAAQRFWDAAMVGCVNVLPSRTKDQSYFPDIQTGEHYLTFSEDLAHLELEFQIDDQVYNEISANARSLYDAYMKPTDYAIGTPILEHIFSKIEEYAV